MPRSLPQVGRLHAPEFIMYTETATTASSLGGDTVEYNPYSPAIQHNPFPVYRWMRDEAPVYHNEKVGFWALSRYDDVLAASLDTATFLSGHGMTIEGLDAGNDILINKDEPEHLWHRRLVSRVFTPMAVAAQEPTIRAIVSRASRRRARARAARHRRRVLVGPAGRGHLRDARYPRRCAGGDPRPFLAHARNVGHRRTSGAVRRRDLRVARARDADDRRRERTGRLAG